MGRKGQRGKRLTMTVRAAIRNFLWASFRTQEKGSLSAPRAAGMTGEAFLTVLQVRLNFGRVKLERASWQQKNLRSEIEEI